MLLLVIAHGQAVNVEPRFRELKQRYQQQEYEKIIPLADSLETLAIAHKDLPMQSDILNIKANTLRRLGKEEKALEIHHQILAIRQHLYGSKSLKVANTLHNIGNCWLGIDQADQAYPFLAEALQIRQQKLPKNDDALAAIYSALGIYHRLKNDFRQAEILSRKAISIRTAAEKMQSQQGLSLLINLGNLLIDQKKHSAAESVFHDAEVLAKQLNNNSHLKALLFSGKASCLIASGQLDTALLFYQNALEIYTTTTNHPIDMASCLDQIGQCYLISGQYEAASSYFRQSLAHLLPQQQFFSTRIANVYNNLALSLRHQKRIRQAIEYHEKAVKLYLSKDQQLHPTLAGFYSNIGKCYWQQRQYPVALYYFEKAKEIQHNNRQSETALAFSFIHTGNCHSESKEYQTAIDDYKKAIEILQRSNYDNQLALYLPFLNIAQVLQQSGQPKEALKYVSQALLQLNMLEFVPSYQHAKVLSTQGRSLQILAQQSKLKEDWLKAYKSFSKAEGLLQEVYDHSKYNGVELYHRNDFFELYEGLVSTSYQLSQFQPEYKDTAHHYSEQYKASLLKKAIQSEALQEVAGIPDSLIAQEKTLSSKLYYLKQLSLQETQKGPLADQIQLSEWYQQEAALEKELHAIKELLQTKYQAYHQLRYSTAHLSIDSIRNQLNGKQSMLIFFMGKHELFTFLINQDTFIITANQQLPDITEEIIDYYYLLTTRPDMQLQPDLAYQQMGDYAHHLYNYLLSSVAKHLKQELIIIPDGLLCYLPFETLLIVKPKHYHLFDQHDYLIKHYDISYLFAADLFNDPLKTKTAGKRNLLLGMAPDFTNDPRGLRHLEYNDQEVTLIQSLLGGKELLHTHASKDAFLSDAGNYQILHLATHSVLDQNAPEYSYLAFNAGEEETIHDNLLFLYEVYGLQLKADMAVLSACQTGIGQYHRGEGMMSIARAFTYAGANSIVSSLWSIDDQQTHQLMSLFYDALKEGLPKNQALRMAKSSYLETVSPDHAHPYYWAAITLNGSNTPIHISRSSWWWLGLLFLAAIIGLLAYWKLSKNA